MNFKSAKDYAAEIKWKQELAETKRWSSYEKKNQTELCEIYGIIENEVQKGNTHIKLPRKSPVYEPNSSNQKELELFHYLVYKGFKPQSRSYSTEKHVILLLI